MLVRTHNAAARAMCTTIASSFFVPRCPLVASRPSHAVTSRAYHSVTGEFTSFGPNGTLVTKEIIVRVGDPGEAYVYIPTEIGCALRAATSLTRSPLASILPERRDRLALDFFHDTRHFALASSPGYPRLVIPQPLPRQSVASTSPATLYLYGLMHTIALNGTPDAEFAELASTILPDLGGALEKLKDR